MLVTVEHSGDCCMLLEVCIRVSLTATIWWRRMLCNSNNDTVAASADNTNLDQDDLTRYNETVHN